MNVKFQFSNFQSALPPFVSGAWEGFDYPLLKLFLCLAIGALLVVALLRRRHRSEMLAACLSLSIVLHLLSLSFFSVMPIGKSRLEAAPRAVAHRIEIGTPSIRESLASQSVRAEPLKTDLVDTHARLATERAARSEPVKEEAAKAQANLKEGDARIAGRVEVKAPDITPPKKVIEDPLEAVPDHPVEVAPVKIAVQQEAKSAPETKQPEPGAREKQFDVTPVVQAALPVKETKPSAPRDGLKDASQMPARAKIELAAVAGRQPEVKDAIQPAEARANVDRLEDRARAVEAARGPGKDQPAAPVEPSAELKLVKQAGAAPRTAEQRMKVETKTADQPKMAADSLAAAGPDGIERKKSEVSGPAPAAADAARLEPVQMGDVQPLMAAPRSGEPQQAASDQREWNASKERSGAQASLPASTAKPNAPQGGLKDASQSPARAKIELAALAGRQVEVTDAIQPAETRANMDRLEDRANVVEDGRGSGKDERSAVTEPTAEVTLGKQAGGAPRTAERRMTAAAKAGGQPKMAADSLAAAGPDGIERKKNEVGGLAPEAAGDAARLEPVRMSDVQPLVAAPRSGGSGQDTSAAPAGRGEWKASKEQSGAPASLPASAAKPNAPQGGLKDASQSPARAKIEIAALAGRQAEVTDAIQPAEARANVDRLNVRASAVEDGRGSGKDERSAVAEPTAEVKLGKQAGGAPRAAERRMTAAAKAGGQPKMAADSLAAAVPDGIERKKSGFGGLAPEAAGDAARLEPVRMSDVQPLVAAPRSGGSGQEAPADPSGRRELTASRGQSAMPGTEAVAGGKPQAEITDAAPSKEPIRIGVGGGGTLTGPTSRAAAVQDGVSDLPAGQLGVQSLGDSAQQIALAQNDRRGTVAGGDNLGPSELAAVKQGGGLTGDQIGTNRVAPKRVAGSQKVGTASGTLIDGAGGTIRARDSASTEVQEQLAVAQAGGGNSGEQSLADMGSPAQAVAGVARAGSLGGGSEVGPAALAPARTGRAGAVVEAGGIERPSPTRLGDSPGRSASAEPGALWRSRAGRSDLPAGQGSFVGRGAGIAAPQAASSAMAEGEQVETGAPVALALGDAKVLAGKMNVENMQGGESRTASGGSGDNERGQAELALGKAGGSAGSAVSVKRVQAPGGVAGGSSAGPAGMLVDQADLQASIRPAAGTAQGEALAGVNISAGETDASGPTLAAPVVPRGSSGGGTAKAGIAPVGSLQVAKSGAAQPLQLERKAGGGLGELAAPVSGAAERGPVRMDVSLSEGPPQARVTSDISAAPAGQAPRRSFLSVGNAPNPESVPQKAIYKMRKPEKRRQYIKELGGTPQTEEAVEQALDWLSRTQSDDGRWDVDGFKTLRECGGAGDLANEDVAVTGLSLLAYLGAGYTHLEDAHKETVRKGLDWLLNCEMENGDIRGAGQMYGQAIATAALCESYSLTGDERLLEPARRAVQFIVDSQTPESGWRYEPRNDSDTSVTGWQILALKSAQIAGIAVPEQTFKWTELWLDKVRQGEAGGLYSYKPGHAVTPVMTAEGAFCQLFMSEQTRTRGQAESIACIMQNLPAWDPEKRSVHLYYWYYATLALYLSGTQEFEAWNSALTKALLDGRRKSGPAAGSWDPVCHLGPRGGRLYSTAAGALCLEVYYRFLPLYKQK